VTASDRPTREQLAQSIADRIDWTPTHLADFGERAAIVEQVLRVAEHESAAEVRALRAEAERKVSIDVRMERPTAPDWGGEEDDDGVQLYHHAWDSTDETLRLWVGPYAVGESGPWWAVTVNAPGIDVVMRCTPEQVVEWADMVKAAVTDGPALGPALVARTPQPAERWGRPWGSGGHGNQPAEAEIDERCTPEEEAHDEMCPGCVTCLHPDAAPPLAERCPRCDSHRPELHPAVQHGGEVSVCTDPWHASSETGRDVLARLNREVAPQPAECDGTCARHPAANCPELAAPLPAVPDGEDDRG
jgi:hypothetical protein